MIFRRMLVIALALFSLSNLSACTEQQKSLPPVTHTLTVATYYGEMSSILLYTSESGLFRQQGVEVTLLRSQSGVTAVDSVIKGEADLGTAAEFVFVGKSFDTPDLSIYCTIDESQSIDIISLKSRNIMNPENLRGIRIGVTKGTAAEYYLDRYLENRGVSDTTVRIIARQPQTLLDGLRDGTLDAVIVWNPLADQIRQSLGDKVVSLPAQGNQPFCFCLVGTNKLVQEKHEAMTGFLTALIKGSRMLKENPSASRILLAKTLSTTPERLAAQWKDHDFGVRLNRRLMVTLEQQARWNMAKGLVKQDHFPNYLHRLELDLLKQVAPEAVTIIY